MPYRGWVAVISLYAGEQTSAAVLADEIGAKGPLRVPPLPDIPTRACSGVVTNVGRVENNRAQDPWIRTR